MIALKKFLSGLMCRFGGHRPVKLESELVRQGAPPQWSFRCGDCGKKYWWPK